jgi:hypothetical protein
MKKVFSSANECIHIFAQRSQSEGRSNNVFFENDCIYSYGHHYLLAEFIKNGNNEEAILINDTGYSNTTAKHIHWVTSATSQYKQFFKTETVPATVLRQLNYLAEKLSKAKKPELYINPAESLFLKFKEFENWKGQNNDIENTLKINKLINVFRGESYTVYLEEQNKIIKEAQRLEKIKAKKAFRKELKEFFAYKRNYIYNNISGEDYVRISEDGEFIETSQRVRVHVKEAKILYLLIKNGKDIKGYNIDGYTVIGLNGVLKIGCHKINLKNMNEIGERILNTK